MSTHTVPRVILGKCSLGEWKETRTGRGDDLPRGKLYFPSTLSSSDTLQISAKCRSLSGRNEFTRVSGFLATAGDVGFVGSQIFAEGSDIFASNFNSKKNFLKSRAAKKFVIRAAIFDQLSESLEKVWQKLSNETTLTRDNIKEPMREVRRALLEADVSLPVVKRFVSSVSERAVGTDVVRGIRPDQQLVKVVNDELVLLMGGQVAEIQYTRSGPTAILLAGLQGVGKTTACGKLALYLKKKGKSVLMVATDVYRPAAIDQLITLGKQVDVPVFSLGTDVKPEEIARRGLEEAKKKKIDVVLVDTAGRLQIDPVMMEELSNIKSSLYPSLSETLLVVDAMAGQSAAAQAAAFHNGGGEG